MAPELLSWRAVRDELGRVAERGPSGRLVPEAAPDRIQALVRAHGVTIEPKDLIREVAIFAERADIAEEIVRLAATWPVQRGDRRAGKRRAQARIRVQEMFRETNTIGSKANDVEICRHVVEIKGALEKIRELIQNVE